MPKRPLSKQFRRKKRRVNKIAGESSELLIDSHQTSESQTTQQEDMPHDIVMKPEYIADHHNYSCMIKVEPEELQKQVEEPQASLPLEVRKPPCVMFVRILENNTSSIPGTISPLASNVTDQQQQNSNVVLPSNANVVKIFPNTNVVKISPNTNLVKLPATTNVVKMPPTTNVVKISPNTNLVKLPLTTNVVQMPPNTNVAKMPPTTNVVKMPPNTIVAKMPSTTNVVKMLPTTNVAKMLPTTNVVKMPPTANAVKMPPNTNVVKIEQQQITPHEAMMLFKAVEELLHRQLPPYWITFVDDTGLHVILLSRKPERASQRRVHVNRSGDMTVTVHCIPMPIESFLEGAGEKCVLHSESVSPFAERILKVVSNLRFREVCCGADDLNYKQCWGDIKNAVVDNNPYQECRYNETLRSARCPRLVNVSSRRCTPCSKLLSSLKKRKSLTLTNEDISLYTANSYLSEEQKIFKLKAQQNEIHSLKTKCTRLQEKLNELMESENAEGEEEEEEEGDSDNSEAEENNSESAEAEDENIADK